MTPRSLIKLALFGVPAILLVGVALLIVTPRPTAQPEPLATWLPANSETRVDFHAVMSTTNTVSSTRLYNFTAPGATRLKLISSTPGFAFAAEIRDAAGRTVAAFNDTLESVQFTLAGDPGQYQIALTPTDPKANGTVALALGSAVIAPSPLDGTALRASDCRVVDHPVTAAAAPADSAADSATTNVAAETTNALIRSAPSAQYAVIGLLPVGASLPVIGRTDNGWYTVDFNERQAWISGAVVDLVGDCTGVSTVRNPAIPTAPRDADALLLQVDRDGSGTLHQTISTPDGDTSDLIWVQVINLYSAPPNNYREFALTLDCHGEGSENLRWGSAYQPTLHCGETLVLPFLIDDAQHPISVLFPPGSRQSYAEYDLSVLSTDAVG